MVGRKGVILYTALELPSMSPMGTHSQVVYLGG